MTRLQSFEIERVSRAQIKGAPYNPRKISAINRKKLKANLQKVGLLEPLVWNRRTGNLVGGHQRISLIDALEKSDNYTIDVAAVDLSEAQEREQNIALNNPLIQGEWDDQALLALLKHDDVDLGATGFDAEDIAIMFDDPEVTRRWFAEPAPELAESVGEVTKIDALKSRREELKQGVRDLNERHDTEAYVVVLFASPAERSEFTSLVCGGPDERYANGKRLLQMLNEARDA